MPGGPDGAPACTACGLWLEKGTLFCPKCGASQSAVPPKRKGLAGDTFLRSPVTPPPADASRVFAGRYRVLELLGKGGMGSVYKVEHIRMNKAMALKVMRPEFSRHPAAAERFAAEAQVVAKLTHPNTVMVHDFGEAEDGSLFIAMEYCAGEDLSSLLRTLGRLPSKRAADLTAQVLGALAEAHELGVIHRDMKPANVMLTTGRKGEDVAKVLDFGIAKLAGDVGGISGGLTAAGQLVGTPNYMSPEQARGDVLTPASDLYACGAMLYELVTGKLPFEAPTPMGIVTAHITQPLRPPREVASAAGIPLALEAVILQSMEKEPAKRFASAEQMREALLKVVAGEANAAALSPFPGAQAAPANAYDAALSFSLDSVITPRPASSPAGPSAARLAALEPPTTPAPGGSGRVTPLPGLAPVAESFEQPLSQPARPIAGSQPTPRAVRPPRSRSFLVAAGVGVGILLGLGGGAYAVRDRIAALLEPAPVQNAGDDEAIVVPVKIASDPTGALVFLDNSPIGKTPIDTIAGFADGQVVWIRVELEGYEPSLTKVIGGEPIQVKARLKRKRP